MSEWATEYLVSISDGERDVPAVGFLASIPANVAMQLLENLNSVTDAGPDRWFEPKIHCAMKGNLKDLHEVRDRQGQQLYRLFVKWLRYEKVVVIIDGREKPNKSALAESEYKAIRKLADLIDQKPRPFASVTDINKAGIKARSAASGTEKVKKTKTKKGRKKGVAH